MIHEQNKNYEKGDINSPVGMEGDERRFVAFNGGLGSTQLSWLESELEAARTNDERVIICAHQPFHHDSTNLLCLTLNYEEILKSIQRFNDVVIATFSGHTHWPGDAIDKGIHHIVFSAVLESEPGIDTYAVIRLFDDFIRIQGEISGSLQRRLTQNSNFIKGFGDEVDRVLKFKRFGGTEKRSNKRNSDEL